MLPKPFSRTPLISPFKPFTRSSLAIVSEALISAKSRSSYPRPPDTSSLILGAAAVLVPFCNIEGVASVLMEVRSVKMRTHAGEIAFPGGRVDPTDLDAFDTAKREAFEELNILPDQVELLGEVGSLPNGSNTMMVSPIIGFVHPQNRLLLPILAHDEALHSLNLASLSRQPSEVSHILPVPLSCLVEEDRVRPGLFRDRDPYWTIRVGDLLQEREKDMNELRIWGLSGWVLIESLRALKIYED